MKYLLTKSKVLDLNYTFVQDGSGSVDNVTYSVPAYSQGVLSVDAQGKVTALVEQGVGSVEIKTGNALLEVVTVEVMPLADYTLAMGIKDGSTPFSSSASVTEVPQVPQLIKISPTANRVFANDIDGQYSGWLIAAGYIHFAANHGPLNATSSGTGYDAAISSAEAGRYDYLYDGRSDTFWFASAANASVGYYGSTPTTLKEIRIKSTDANLTSRPTYIELHGSNQDPVSVTDPGSPDYGTGINTGWTQIGTRNVTWGNVVSEDRTADFSENTTAYKHYKVRFNGGPYEPYIALAGVEFWGHQ